MNIGLSKYYRLATEAHKLSAAERWRAHNGKNLPVRLGQVGLGEVLHGLSFNRFISQFDGYRFLDGNWESVVLEAEDQSHVMKILLGSNSLSQTKAANRAMAHQKLSDRVGEFLGDQWTQTTFYPHSMRTFPTLLPGYAVTAFQERLQPVTSFASAEDLLAPGVFERVTPELSRLAGGIRELHRRWGIYPDIRGAHNIMLVPEGGTEKIKLVDTTISLDENYFRAPVPEGGMTVGQETEAKLRAWELALAGSSQPTEWSESQELALR